MERGPISIQNACQIDGNINEDGPFSSLFRVAIQGDFAGYKRPWTTSASEGIDACIQNPSWLVPISQVEAKPDNSWARNSVHPFNPATTEDDLSNSFGIDIRSGTVRDWNKELQGTRGMSVAALQDRRKAVYIAVLPTGTCLKAILSIEVERSFLHATVDITDKNSACWFR
jgi:hypothetical protein